MLRLTMLALIAALATPLPLIPLGAWAADVPALEDGKRKINLSGRQRMLSQRMAKAACFAAIGVQPTEHLAQTQAAHDLFDTTLHGLRHGDADQGMNVETTPRILNEMTAVEELWTSYGAAVANAATNADAAQAALTRIAEMNLPVLRQMNKTVGEFERHYGGTGEIHPVLALAINVSGRQRMLSQKASKEFCLILAGVDAEGNRASLAKTVEMFETSLLALKDGNPDMGLPPAPTDQIQAQLQTVSDLWAPLKVVFDATIAGTPPTPAQIDKVAHDNNPLLKEMNKAVSMYSQL